MRKKKKEEEVHEFEPITEFESAVMRTVVYSVLEIPLHMGKRKMIDILRGSVGPEMFAQNLQTMETYGLLSPFRRAQIDKIIDKAVEFNLLEWTGHEQSSTLQVTDAGEMFIWKGAVPHYIKGVFNVDGQRRAFESEDILNRLLSVRSRWAAQEGVRPYSIFSNRTLLEIIRKMPKDLDALHEIYGIGEDKLNMFGEDILDAVWPGGDHDII